ncbi:hypothetical protein Q604_UNBC10396G0001, partial [human gut metagenome]
MSTDSIFLCSFNFADSRILAEIECLMDTAHEHA